MAMAEDITIGPTPGPIISSKRISGFASPNNVSYPGGVNTGFPGDQSSTLRACSS